MVRKPCEKCANQSNKVIFCHKLNKLPLVFSSSEFQNAIVSDNSDVVDLTATINETFDKILLQRLLPSDISESQVGMYAACYKIGVLMTLFTTAFRLGIEPYFFKHFNSIKPQYHYARILEAFVALGTSMLLVVIVGADFIKQILIFTSFWTSEHFSKPPTSMKPKRQIAIKPKIHSIFLRLNVFST